MPDRLESVPTRPCVQCGSLLPEENLPPARVTELKLPPQRDAVCCQCGGPAAAGSRTVPVGDLYGRSVPWPVCAVCDGIAAGERPEIAVIRDVLDERAGLAAQHACSLLDTLVSQPAPHPVAHVEITWSILAQRLPGLGPYHRVAPRADPRNAPGARWGHLDPALVGKIGSILEWAYSLRVPVPPVGGGTCHSCGRERDLPGRWGTFAGQPVCGGCQDGVRAQVPVPDYLDPGRMGAL